MRSILRQTTSSLRHWKLYLLLKCQVWVWNALAQNRHCACVQLGLPDKGRAMKGIVVFNSWDLEPLDLLNVLALGCCQSSPEYDSYKLSDIFNVNSNNYPFWLPIYYNIYVYIHKQVHLSIYIHRAKYVICINYSNFNSTLTSTKQLLIRKYTFITFMLISHG